MGGSAVDGLVAGGVQSGRHIQSLPSILDRYRMMEIAITPKIAMQADRIVGQCVPPIRGLRKPVSPVPGRQLFARA